MVCGQQERTQYGDEEVSSEANLRGNQKKHEAFSIN